MPTISDLLDQITAEHDRIGTPLRRYLRRPGPPTEQVRARLSALGLPDDIVGWFAAQDGVAQDAWHRDTGGPILELVWGCEPIGLETALTDRRAALEGVTKRPDVGGSWIPVCRTQDIEYVAAAPDGAILLVDSTPGFEGTRQAFPGLGGMLEAMLARLRSGFYRWDASTRSMQAGSATHPQLDAETPLAPEPAGDPWELPVRALEAYAAREGSLDIPPGHLENGVMLDALVRSLRRARPDEVPERVRARLEALPGWRWAGP
ncbi:MAG: helicase associated domain-containing protein [Actinomycetota bacterium]